MSSRDRTGSSLVRVLRGLPARNRLWTKGGVGAVTQSGFADELVSRCLVCVNSQSWKGRFDPSTWQEAGSQAHPYFLMHTGSRTDQPQTSRWRKSQPGHVETPLGAGLMNLGLPGSGMPAVLLSVTWLKPVHFDLAKGEVSRRGTEKLNCSLNLSQVRFVLGLPR